MYIPFAVGIEIRHRQAGELLPFTIFHKVTTFQIGWQTFDMTPLFKSTQNRVPASFRVKLWNFNASRSEAEARIWSGRKPMLIVASQEQEAAWSSLMDGPVLRRMHTANRTEFEPKRTARATGPTLCAKTPLSWRVAAADLGKVLGLKMHLVSPTLVSLGYCSGDCARSSLLNAHSYLRAKFAKKPRLQLPPAISVGTNPSRSPRLPLPCCVPVKFRSVSIMYVDTNFSRVSRTLKDAVVTECGCR